jgi:hypothetical protein
MYPGAPKPMKLGGLYPGSGVAPGGQQGRIGAMHGGVTGARRGGSTPGASQRKTLPALQPAGWDELMKMLMQGRLR